MTPGTSFGCRVFALFACLVVEPLHTPSQSSGIIYEIYVRSFQDSDGDGVGDLNGVRQRLEYLDALQVDTLWLMPVFESFGPAGYDVTSYEQLEEAYGSPEDLKMLTEEAHMLGMTVLLDIPFNHVHRSHPWFQEALQGGEDRFVFARQPGIGSWFEAEDRWFYGYFGEELPDLNWKSPQVEAEMGAIFEHWLETGIDGYRLDAVLMLEEEGAVLEGSEASHLQLSELYSQVHAIKPDAIFLSEASEQDVEESVRWLGTEESPQSDQVLDFPMLEAFSTGIETGSAKPVRAVLETQGEAALGMARFLSSHDLSRLPNRVADPEARRALKVAQLLLPGAPVLYYGEELDLPDSTLGTGQDFNMRAAMPWDTGLWAGFSTGTPWFPPEQGFGRSVAEEALDPDSMLVLVQTLSCLRSKVAGGTFRLVEDEPEVLAFAWDVGEEWLEARVNFSGRAVDGLVAYGYLVEHSGLECSELH